MSTIRPLVAEAVGENLDALVTIDLRGYHVGRILYRAAREEAGEPLVLAAARSLIADARRGKPIFILTGFPFEPYGKPELDGIVGTAVVARALDLALGARPVIVTDPVTVPVMRDLLTLAGLNLYEDPRDLERYPHSGAVIPFTTDPREAIDAARRLCDDYSPTGLIAIEKPGANDRGVFHQGNGADVSSMVAKTDAVFDEVKARGLRTVAIGDLGNEVGLGSLAEVLESQTPFGERFVRAPTGSIAARTVADHVVIASVTDWGAYGLSAMIAFLTGEPSAFHTPSIHRQLLWGAVRGGALDGSGRGEPHVDGVGEDYGARLVGIMRDIIEILPVQSSRFSGVIDRLEQVRQGQALSTKGTRHA
jgi:hypothetical protein